MQEAEKVAIIGRMFTVMGMFFFVFAILILLAEALEVKIGQEGAILAIIFGAVGICDIGVGIFLLLLSRSRKK